MISKPAKIFNGTKINYLPTNPLYSAVSRALRTERARQKKSQQLGKKEKAKCARAP